ncbi:hypothetical protein BHM03_00054186 [Ensete ventricosum]|nr:hypothetical protein BHM03_00054186 [Ensete ventricosum]
MQGELVGDRRKLAEGDRGLPGVRRELAEGDRELTESSPKVIESSPRVNQKKIERLTESSPEDAGSSEDRFTCQTI